MDMRGKNQISLRGFFLRYLLWFCLGVVLILTSITMLFLAGIQVGIILPANYAETKLQEEKEHLAREIPMDFGRLPTTATYLLIESDGSIRTSTLSERDRKAVRESLSAKQDLPKSQFFSVDRVDGSRLLVRYDVAAHFAHPLLHKWFPHPELAALGAAIVLILLVAWRIAVRFSKRLKVEISPLQEATVFIQHRELEFAMQPGTIRELNELADSVSQLKESLSVSLREQWASEKRQNEQIRALTHDIKTPLTIVKGNAELLEESDLSPENRELLGYIQSSADQIEKYADLLMEASAVNHGEREIRRFFSVDALVHELAWQAKALSKPKKLDLSIRRSKLPAQFYGELRLIGRAVANMLDNAAEHSPAGERIEWEIESDHARHLRFSVSDQGDGFTEEELKQAKNAFYTRQKERSGRHYGMGLFIADTAARRHNGTLTLQNNGDGKGARVQLDLFAESPDQKETFV